jgi:hypothetical protein
VLRGIKSKTYINTITKKEKGEQNMLAIIIFIALIIEVLKYLTGGSSKDFWG